MKSVKALRTNQGIFIVFYALSGLIVATILAPHVLSTAEIDTRRDTVSNRLQLPAANAQAMGTNLSSADSRSRDSDVTERSKIKSPANDPTPKPTPTHNQP